jgi:hypothetical protein
LNAQGTVFNFGNGAAGGVMPARKLQSVGKAILRPFELVTQIAHLLSDDIPYLHFPPAISHGCAEILA